MCQPIINSLLTEETEQPSTSASATGTMTNNAGTMKPSASATPWLHEHMTRDKSEVALRAAGQVGAFLMRSSSSPGDYSVSVNVGAHIEHFKLSLDQASGKYVFGQRRFDSLPELVLFYKTNAIYTLANQTSIFLLHPYIAQ